MDTKMNYIWMMILLCAELFAQDYTRLINIKENYLRQQQLHLRNIEHKEGFNELIQVVFNKDANIQLLETKYNCKEKIEITPKIRVYQCQDKRALDIFLKDIKKDIKNIIDIRIYKKYKFRTF